MSVRVSIYQIKYLIILHSDKVCILNAFTINESYVNKYIVSYGVKCSTLDKQRICVNTQLESSKKQLK